MSDADNATSKYSQLDCYMCLSFKVWLYQLKAMWQDTVHALEILKDNAIWK